MGTSFISLGIYEDQAAAGFSYDDIPNQLVRLDASDTGSITDTAGAASQWNDLSGNGNHVLQATGANQPTTGSRTINGLNVMDFGGSHWMETASKLTAISQPFTIMLLCELDSGANASMVAYHSTRATVNERAEVRYNFSGGAYSLDAGTEAVGTTAQSGLQAIMAVFNGASTVGYVDGGSDEFGDVGSNNPEFLRVGARGNDTLAMNGAIAEVIICTGATSTANLNAVGNHWASKWGITFTEIT